MIPIDKLNTNLFWSKTILSGNQCILWIGVKNKKGYGRVNIKGTVYLTHRVSYALSNGAFDENLCVLHSCDTPNCVNPNHLFLGTKAENNADMRNKGRACEQVGTHKRVSGLAHGRYTKPEKTARGERNGSSKLSDFEINALRHFYDKKLMDQRLLSHAFGVHISTVNRIVNYKTRVICQTK